MFRFTPRLSKVTTLVTWCSNRGSDHATDPSAGVQSDAAARDSADAEADAGGW
ncbi:hypothetical protein Sya03_51550 [Spirilliplanes yamanashiensis]|uniref:Uncharacterized protein n=1 Tax=Spirilliplanes yamanashiensis TaxID=42233 RepID=A0A8J4DLW1_9ACTN|nr:hypothetical protein Sya03_51550 [Spirilliplanes yamanashiensis]